MSSTAQAAQKKSTDVGLLALVIGAICIGFSPILMRMADVGDSAAGFWRIGLALIILWPVWLWRLKAGHEQLPPRETIKPLFWMGFWFMADLFFWHWSISRTGVANATLLANMSVVYTALFAILFLRHRPRGGFYLGLGLAIIGAGLLAGANALFQPENLIGDGLGVATGLAYTGYIVTVSENRGRLSTLAVMTAGGSFTALLLLPVDLSEPAPFLPASSHGWWPLIGLGVITHVIGQSLIAWGVMRVAVTIGSLILLVQPVIAALLAWMLFDESLGAIQMVGVVAILTGLALAKLRG